MKNRNGGKRIIIVLIIILLILAIAGCGIYIYLATDLFKTPEQLFKKYMLSNIIELGQTEFKPFDEIEKRSENELTEYHFKAGFETSSLDYYEEGDENEKYEYNIFLRTDIPNKNEELEVLINRNENEYFKANMALTNETFGISVPDLYDKYLAIENRDFKKIAKTFELPEEYIEYIPDKIPSSLTPEEEEQISQLANKYLTKIVEQFDENSYIAEKDINITVNSKELVTNKYTLSMSSKNLYTSLTDTITELLDDPEFVALTKDKITTEQLDELKTKYKEFLTENPATDIEDQTLKISVYAADGRTVKTEIKSEENEAYFIIDKNEIENTIIFSAIEPKNEYNEVGTTETTIIKSSYKDDAGEITLETLVEYNKDDIETLQAEYDAEYADYGSHFDKNYSEIYVDESKKYTIKTKKSNEDVITGTITSTDEDFEYMDMSFKCQFGKASVTTLSEKNSVVINDYTMDDYTKLVEEIGINVMSVVLQKPDSLIGVFLTDTVLGGFDTEDEDSYYSDDYTSDDYSADDYTNDNYSDITFPDDESNDNYLYPTVTDNLETLREEIDTTITNSLSSCLYEYQNELIFNSEANLGDFLNLDKVQEYSGSDYILELPDSTTIKCTVNREGIDYIYYALMNIDGENYTVREVEVLTEEEYLNR